MRARRTTAVALSGILLGALAACGDDADPVAVSPAGSTTSAAPSSPATSGASSASSTNGSDEMPPPEVGECYTDTDEMTTEVACDTAHDVEVVAVKPDTKYADDPLKRAAHRQHQCFVEGDEFVGAPSAATRLVILPITTGNHPAAATHLICGAFVAAPTLSEDATFPDLTKSLRNVLKGDGYDEYKLCYAGRASDDDMGKVVPCDEPHASESFTLVPGGSGDPDAKFPGLEALNKKALPQCRKAGAKYVEGRKDITIAANAGGANSWREGFRQVGCFLQTTDGSKVTKSLLKAGKTPVSELR